MKRAVLGAGLALAGVMAGCSGEQAPAEAGPDSAVAATGSTPPVQPVVFENSEKRGEYEREFKYNWPAEANAVPELVARFVAERDAALAEQKQDFEEALREFAGQDCVGCINRSYDKEWAVVADLPRFLSLSATIYMYTGGAHGNGNYDALVWDREAGKVLAGADLFTSPAALQGALGDAWCKGLTRERKQRLGDDYSEDSFFPCPDIAELTVLLGSAGKQSFDRIGLLAAPYVAGSYAEGSYEVTVPVSEAVIAAVKPEYRSYFAAAK